MAAIIRTLSESRTEWRGEIVHGQSTLTVAVDGRKLPTAQCPSLESLKRRYRESGKQWVEDWMGDENDPTLPD